MTQEYGEPKPAAASEVPAGGRKELRTFVGPAGREELRAFVAAHPEAELLRKYVEEPGSELDAVKQQEGRVAKRATRRCLVLVVASTAAIGTGLWQEHRYGVWENVLLLGWSGLAVALAWAADLLLRAASPQRIFTAAGFLLGAVTILAVVAWTTLSGLHPRAEPVVMNYGRGR